MKKQVFFLIAVKKTCWTIKTVMHTVCRQQRKFLAVRYLDIILKPHKHVNTFTYTLSWAHTAGTPQTVVNCIANLYHTLLSTLPVHGLSALLSVNWPTNVQQTEIYKSNLEQSMCIRNHSFNSVTSILMQSAFNMRCGSILNKFFLKFSI